MRWRGSHGERRGRKLPVRVSVVGGHIDQYCGPRSRVGLVVAEDRWQIASRRIGLTGPLHLSATDVLALAAISVIASRPAEKNIRPARPSDHIITRPTLGMVSTRPADEVIAAVVATQEIITGTAAHAVLPIPAARDVVAAAATDPVVTGAADQQIAAGGAI
jgi:hypothetical protein